MGTSATGSPTDSLDSQPGSVARTSWAATLQRPDKRRHRRRYGRFDVWLLYDDGQTVLRCRADDVSEGGVHAVLPPGCTVDRGQRFRVHVCPASPWAGFGDATRVLGPASVVRAERLIGEEGDVQAVGLAFDAPVDWPIPSKSAPAASRPH